ncbi:MAG: hypothetical protein GY809_12935 [Planctomycetes bacterium]|nr:hypothetical protein [Planctomycetota bacterium]
MTSILRAITWEFWRENRWWIVVSVSAILGLGGLIFSSPLSERDAEDEILHFTIHVLEMWIFATLLCAGQYSKVKNRLGFPEHLFVKPVRMRSVAMIRLGLATTTGVSLYLLTAVIFCSATGMAWPIALPCLYLTSCIVFLHAVAWSLSAIPALQIILSATGLYILCVLHFYDLQSTDSSNTLGLLIFIGLSTSLALAGAALDRRSQRLKLTALWNKITMAATACLPWKTCTDVSPQGALFWYHWTKKGWILPAMSVSLMILGYVLTWAVPWRKPESFIMVYFFCTFLFHVVGFPLLASLIACQQETENQGLPTYASSLPVTNRDMLMAYLKASLASLVISWGILIVGLGLLQLQLMIASQGHHTEELFKNITNMIQFFHPVLGMGKIPLANLLRNQIGYFLMAWAGLGLVGSMILSGRRSVGVTTMIIMFTWPIVPALAEALDVPEAVFVGIITVEALLFILFIIGGTMAAYVYGTFKKRIHPVVTLTSLIAYVALNLFYVQNIWRAPEDPLVSLALLAVLTLPLAPFATAPLALAWNRHR